MTARFCNLTYTKEPGCDSVEEVFLKKNCEALLIQSF